jgi:hypothetical protein
MAIISVDVAMRRYPGLAASAMCAGGTCIDNNEGNPGVIIDIADAVRDPDRLYFIDVQKDNFGVEDLEEVSEDDEEDAVEHTGSNPDGVTREQVLRDMVERLSEDESLTAEELLTRFHLEGTVLNTKKLERVKLRTSKAPHALVHARVAILEEKSIKGAPKLKKPNNEGVAEHSEQVARNRKARKVINNQRRKLPKV